MAPRGMASPRAWSVFSKILLLILDIYMEKEPNKKFVLGMTGYSLLILLGRAALAGIAQAFASFFVKSWLSKKEKS